MRSLTLRSSSTTFDIEPPTSTVNADIDVSENNTSTTASTGSGNQGDIPVDVEAGIRSPQAAIWMFYDDDGHQECKDPWLPCDEELSSQMEAAYQHNPVASVIIQNDKWRYQVDLGRKTQTNLDHPAHRCRSLRRVPLS